MRKNILAITIIGMLFLSSFMVMPTVGASGNTIYVDDDNTGGPWNGTQEDPYRNIQDGINNSSNGDTVFVYNGTYYENVIVNRSINLIGEDKDITIINGSRNENVVNISADHVNISGFTIQYGGISSGGLDDPIFAGVYVSSDFNTILDNNIDNNQFGVFLDESSGNNIQYNNITNNELGIALGLSNDNVINENIINNNDNGTFVALSSFNTISENIITNKELGIILFGSSNNTLTDNDITDNELGIVLDLSNDNIINKNIITDNDKGIYLIDSSYNKIFENIITGNEYGINLSESENNSIYHNNFINNTHNAYDNGSNTWDNDYPSGGNYWDDYTGTDSNWDGIGDAPYNISGGDNRDRYPFMEPWPPEPLEDTTPPVIHSIVPEKALYINNEKIGRTRLVRMALIVGDITIEVNATDNESGIKQVNFTIDPLRPFAKQVANDTTAPYTYNWSKEVIFRFIHIHIIKIDVIDNAGNIATQRIVVRRIL